MATDVDRGGLRARRVDVVIGTAITSLGVDAKILDTRAVYKVLRAVFKTNLLSPLIFRGWAPHFISIQSKPSK